MSGRWKLCLAAALTVLSASAIPAAAGNVEIVDAVAERSSDSWRFSVTLRHADDGWNHYADLWQVFAPDGTLLGERVLAHPHVNEQPFTRSLSGVAIPEGVSEVIIRARDTVHGTSPDEFRIDLPG